MFRSICGSLVACSFAASAGAYTLTITPDQPTYHIGDTITLTVVGDSQGGAAEAIFGQLDYSAALTTTLSASQTVHTTNGVPWQTAPLRLSDGSAWVFNQIRPDGGTPLPAQTVDQLQIATLILRADQDGVVDVKWHTAPPPADSLDFFGSWNQPPPSGTSFTIAPEPIPLALIALGLVGLAGWRRMRA